MRKGPESRLRASRETKNELVLKNADTINIRLRATLAASIRQRTEDGETSHEHCPVSWFRILDSDSFVSVHGGGVDNEMAFWICHGQVRIVLRIMMPVDVIGLRCGDG